jgi:hypothetical protein
LRSNSLLREIEKVCRATIGGKGQENHVLKKAIERRKDN